MTTIVFATANAHKLEEIQAVLPNHIRVLSLKDVGITEEIPETGSTLRGNSAIKAQYVKEKLSPDFSADFIIADDSGLEVEALQGAPGVYSARYAGVPKDDAANNKKLLHALQNSSNRKARFVTVITLITKDAVHVFEGEVKGTIAHEARGISGFGYDPLFIPTGYRSTFAELGSEIKNKISHRALAVEKLRKYLGE